MTKGVLDDIEARELRILLVAINPAPRSLDEGLHFASARNPFWDLLFAAGLTRTRLQPPEAARLLEDGIGLTSLVRRATRTAAELRRAELRQGANELQVTVERLQPRIVALLGLTLMTVVLPDLREPGPGRKSARLGGSEVFVLPNPSGRNRAFPGFQAKLRWYAELAAACSGGRRS